MWWGDDGAYFVASFARTSDGSAAQHDGQVWYLDPEQETIELKLHFAYTPGDQDNDPDGPDNITVSAYGGLILAEDGEGKSHLVGSTDHGETFFFARNEHRRRQRVRRPDVLARPADPVRQRAVARPRVRDPRAVSQAALNRRYVERRFRSRRVALTPPGRARERLKRRAPPRRRASRRRRRRRSVIAASTARRP